MKPLTSKTMAVVAVLAGAGTLAIELVLFLKSGQSGIWFWGPVGLLAIAFGVYELLAARAPGKEPGSRDGKP